MTGWFDYTNPNPLIYSWSMKTLADDNNEKIEFITNLKKAYDWTILQWDPNYKDIVISNPSNQTWTVNLVNNLINLNVWWIKVSNNSLPITYEPPKVYNCTWTLVTTNATITNNAWLTLDTTYQNTNPENKCYYQCINWYTWNNCNTLITYTVTFDWNWWIGHTPTTKTIDYNTAVWVLPTPPTKAWYTFDWWFTQISWWTPVTTETIITESITFFAHWRTCVYTQCQIYIDDGWSFWSSPHLIIWTPGWTSTTLVSNNFNWWDAYFIFYYDSSCKVYKEYFDQRKAGRDNTYDSISLVPWQVSSDWAAIPNSSYASNVSTCN